MLGLDRFRNSKIFYFNVIYHRFNNLNRVRGNTTYSHTVIFFRWNIRQHIEIIQILVRFCCQMSLGQVRFCQVMLFMELAFIFRISGFSKLWIRECGSVQLRLPTFQILYSLLQQSHWNCHFFHSPSGTKYVPILKYKFRSPYSSWIKLNKK